MLHSIVYLMLIVCVILVFGVPLLAVGYSYKKTKLDKHKFTKGDKVHMLFHGSPAVLATAAFGKPGHKPLISSLSDQDRTDIAPCGSVEYYASNGGLDFMQKEEICTSIPGNVSHSRCSTAADCAPAQAFHCKQDSDCAVVKAAGYTGKCNTGKGYCEPGGPNKGNIHQKCLDKNSNIDHKHCGFFQSKADCFKQMTCCAGGSDVMAAGGGANSCGTGQKCVKPTDSSFCKDSDGKTNYPHGKNVCCGGLKTFMVAQYPMYAEGVVKKVHNGGKKLDIQWHAIKVGGGGKPEEDCRFIRSEKNKEAHAAVFGTPDTNPTGISWMADAGKSTGAWNLTSHKVHKNVLHHMDDYSVEHKKVPSGPTKSTTCPARFPYITSNKGSPNEQCCARPPVNRTKKIGGTKKTINVCPDSAQCQSKNSHSLDPYTPMCCEYCYTKPCGGSGSTRHLKDCCPCAQGATNCPKNNSC